MIINYHTSPSKEIISRVVEYYSIKRDQMVIEGVLCGEAGQFIVHVFKFRGNFISVLNKLNDFLDILNAKLDTGKELDSRERETLLGYANRAGEFLIDDPHFLEAHSESNDRMKDINSVDDLNSMLSEFITGMEKSKAYQKKLHERKECLCYCNND